MEVDVEENEVGNDSSNASSDDDNDANPTNVRVDGFRISEFSAHGLPLTKMEFVSLDLQNLVDRHVIARNAREDTGRLKNELVVSIAPGCREHVLSPHLSKQMLHQEFPISANIIGVCENECKLYLPYDEDIACKYCGQKLSMLPGKLLYRWICCRSPIKLLSNLQMKIFATICMATSGERPIEESDA